MLLQTDLTCCDLCSFICIFNGLNSQYNWFSLEPKYLLLYLLWICMTMLYLCYSGFLLLVPFGLLLNLWVQCIAPVCEPFVHEWRPENILFEQSSAPSWLGLSSVLPFSLESVGNKDWSEGSCLSLSNVRTSIPEGVPFVIWPVDTSDSSSYPSLMPLSTPHTS